MRFSSLCGSRHMAEWHILAKVFWILNFLYDFDSACVQFIWCFPFWTGSAFELCLIMTQCLWMQIQLCPCLLHWIKRHKSWIRTILFDTMLTCMFWFLWLICVLRCGRLCDGHNWCLSWSGSISAHKNCMPCHSPVFCFCLNGHSKAAEVQISSLLCEVHMLPFLNEPFGPSIRCQVYLVKDLEI
jgi:hypothetical protein